MATGRNPGLAHSPNWHRRRAEIIDRSARVFAARGYHGTSTVELCEANEIGKGALYYYIGSKEQLLVAIHDRVMDEVMAGADRVVDSKGSPLDQLTMLGDELLGVIARHPDHVWVFLHEFPALTGDQAKYFRDRRRQYERLVERVFEAGTRGGDFREIDPRLATRAWLGMHNYTYLWLKAGGRLSTKEIARTFADIFVCGLANPAAAIPAVLVDTDRSVAG